jgi:hypothetical protein
VGAVSSRRGRRHLRGSGKQRMPWYGLQQAWLEPLEADAWQEHGDDLRVSTFPGRRLYRVSVEVPGRRQRVEITINFYERPPYDCYGLPPEEYPRVSACTFGPSPHRMPSDGSLCLYYPRSAPERRWRPENGLLALIDLARDHVFFEDYWRETGGKDGGEWLGAEQPHGFSEEASA